MEIPFAAPANEHPLNVMMEAARFLKAGNQVALAVLTQTEGGAVRAPGAMMAIASTGAFSGYLSGGCIDEDVRLHAAHVIRDHGARQLRYGSGSPFLDIKLPCGGALDVIVVPILKVENLKRAVEHLGQREPVEIHLTETGIELDAASALAPLFSFVVEPKLSLRIAGRGQDCLSLARLARASGLGVRLQLVDDGDVQAAEAIGFTGIDKLSSTSDLPASLDDAWSAFALMFHDIHWETALLKQATNGPAFYIGAVGSSRTHARRCEALRAAGVSEDGVSRVRGPIGLVPHMRDASMLAVSALAEIVAAFHAREPA